MTSVIIEPAREAGLVFQLFDKNHDGFISNDEIVSVLKQYCSIIPSKLEVGKMLKLPDKNKEGKVTLTEFTKFYCKIMGKEIIAPKIVAPVPVKVDIVTIPKTEVKEEVLAPIIETMDDPIEDDEPEEAIEEDEDEELQAEEDEKPESPQWHKQPVWTAPPKAPPVAPVYVSKAIRPNHTPDGPGTFEVSLDEILESKKLLKHAEIVKREKAPAVGIDVMFEQIRNGVNLQKTAPAPKKERKAPDLAIMATSFFKKVVDDDDTTEEKKPVPIDDDW